MLEKEPRRREITLLEVLGSIIRAHARLGERQAAMDVINELPTLATDQLGIRVTLADQLFAIEEFELAAQVFNQVLQLDPTNGQALIGMARIYLDMLQPAQARQILDSFRPAPPQMRDYLTTYAVYHQRIGEYIEARQIYSDMLRRNENDHSTRYALGMLYDQPFAKDEFEQAKAEFAKIPPTDRLGRDARRQFANILWQPTQVSRIVALGASTGCFSSKTPSTFKQSRKQPGSMRKPTCSTKGSRLLVAFWQQARGRKDRR